MRNVSEGFATVIKVTEKSKYCADELKTWQTVKLWPLGVMANDELINKSNQSV